MLKNVKLCLNVVFWPSYAKNGINHGILIGIEWFKLESKIHSYMYKISENCVKIPRNEPLVIVWSRGLKSALKEQKCIPSVWRFARHRKWALEIMKH